MSQVNDVICQVVAANPGIGFDQLEIDTYAAVRKLKELRVQVPHPDHLYYAGGGYFRQRLDRMCRSGRLVKLLVAGRNRYFVRACVPAGFNLADPTTRLVAADAAEEAGRQEFARLLRLARKVT